MANEDAVTLKNLKVKLIGLKGSLPVLQTDVVKWEKIVNFCKGRSFITSIPKTLTEGKYLSCHSGRIKDLNKAKATLTSQKAKIVQTEMSIAEIELKLEIWVNEQKALQETFEADKLEQQAEQEKAKTEQEKAKIKQELAKIQQEKAKTDREKAKIQQELGRLRVEKAKAEAAERLAKSGSLESAEALLRSSTEGAVEKSWKKPVILSAITVGALALGFGVYKMVK